MHLTGIDSAGNAKLTATDTTTTIDGRTIKGKSYTATTGTGEQLTLNCYKARDFFANVKYTRLKSCASGC